MSGITSEVDSIEYEALQDITPGDFVAVQVRPLNSHHETSSIPATPKPRNVGNSPWYVFAGEVRETDNWHADVDPEESIVNEQDLPKHTSLASIRVAPDLLWSFSADDINDDSQKVTTVPPIKSSPKAPDDAPPPCVLSYRYDQHPHLIVHEAQVERGEIYHVSRSLGVIVDAVYGALVEVEDVLPPGYESPA